jgi:hypothetical protein
VDMNLGSRIIITHSFYHVQYLLSTRTRFKFAGDRSHHHKYKQGLRELIVQFQMQGTVTSLCSICSRSGDLLLN